MKIIKQGDKTKAIDNQKTFKCTHCNCVFEADNREYNTSSIRWDSKGEPTLSTEGVTLYRNIFSCKCPNCGFETFDEEFVKGRDKIG